MKDESGTTLSPCPVCGDDESLAIDSSSAAERSWVECECGLVFQSKCKEENIGRHWNKYCKEATANAEVSGATTGATE